MNTPPNEASNIQEIDLAFLFNSFKNFIDHTGFFIFRILNFFLKNFKTTILLTLLGFGLGYYFYINDSKTYKHEVMVAPNFGSTAYLYAKVKNFRSLACDENFLLKDVSKIEIEPIINLYDFVSDNKENLEIAKYLSENTIEVNKFEKDNATVNLYKYHKITYYTKNVDDKESINKALLTILNDDDYLKERQAIELADSKFKLLEYETSINNINAIFTKLGGNNTTAVKDISIETYTQINDLLKTKNELLAEVNKSKITIVEQSKVIYDVSKNLNIYNANFIKLFVFPILFNFLYLIISGFIKLFRKYKLRIQN